MAFIWKCLSIKNLVRCFLKIAHGIGFLKNTGRDIQSFGSPRILVMKHQVSVSCSGNKEGANFLCDIKTKNGISMWITAELNICWLCFCSKHYSFFTSGLTCKPWGNFPFSSLHLSISSAKVSFPCWSLNFALWYFTCPIPVGNVAKAGLSTSPPPSSYNLS